jgi:hypothetical protein
MLKLFEKSFNITRSASFICLLLLITNILLLVSENNLISSSSHRNLFLLLCFNFALSITIIIYHHSLAASRYSTLYTNHKNANGFETFTLEFFKLSVIFLLANLASSINIKWIPLKMLWISDYASYIICGLIVLRWNSRDFIKKFISIIYKMLCSKHSDDVDFVEILVADVCTSFSRPLMMQVKPEYIMIRAIIFWYIS